MFSPEGAAEPQSRDELLSPLRGWRDALQLVPRLTNISDLCRKSMKLDDPDGVDEQLDPHPQA
ncbi:MAG: hypothetical protein SH850_17320, partial [Planctomycetaceae bacterium]|nr:hypothetical protein [Planctomycetaceae bacterium]